jgi:tRNA(fMet)-specific endonuclease VapC
VTERYLLDTDVLSEPVRAAPRAAVLQRLKRHQLALATAAPVWHELTFGAWRMPPGARRTLLMTYLRTTVQPSLEILPYDASAAEWHGAERARLVAAGRTPPFVDGQIAAIAAVHDVTLATLNARDYALFRGLRIADWSK